ncbi:MAG: response regulator [Bdellovibrionales bacterium]|nr:response regulator [Bdellovibrionales bacterium]
MAYNFLLVDDSSIVRKSLKKTIGMTSLEVSALHEAENGKVALEVLKNEWIDLIFLDINMPIMNGVEFMEALRADENLKDMAVIIVSTEGSKERIQRLEELDVKAYLRKPVTPEDLVEKVEEVLGGMANG